MSLSIRTVVSFALAFALISSARADQQPIPASQLSKYLADSELAAQTMVLSTCTESDGNGAVIEGPGGEENAFVSPARFKAGLIFDTLSTKITSGATARLGQQSALFFSTDPDSGPIGDDGHPRRIVEIISSSDGKPVEVIEFLQWWQWVNNGTIEQWVTGEESDCK